MTTHSLFWAKTNQRAERAPEWRPAYKPVGHHLLDVAAAAARYLAHDPARLNRKAAVTGFAPARHALLCTVLAALHDLGKISPGFQAQVPQYWPAGVLGPMPCSPHAARHQAHLCPHQINRIASVSAPHRLRISSRRCDRTYLPALVHRSCLSSAATCRTRDPASEMPETD